MIQANRPPAEGQRWTEENKARKTPSQGVSDSFPRLLVDSAAKFSGSKSFPPGLPARLPYPQGVTAPRPSAAQPSAPAELELIERIRLRAVATRTRELRLGIGDDCAVLRPRPGEEMVVTTDLSLAGRHFRLDWHPPETVGHRTLARGLSDLAAMGARPVAAFLSLGLPRELVEKQAGRRRKTWIDRFLDGFLALADATGTPLAGGDLAESPVFAADIVLLGAVRRGKALLRSAARPGDLLYVTGALGGAAFGLQRLAEWRRASVGSAEVSEIPRSRTAALGRHLYPQPRLAQGEALVRRSLATAGLDISDGLSTDLAHLCQESRVVAELDAQAIPIASGATLEQALHGGEDYELLFTARASARVPRAIDGVPVTRIGRILRRDSRRPQMTLLTAQGPEPLLARGWQHFSQPIHDVRR